MSFIKEKFDYYFVEILLTVVFIFIVSVTVHLMHKADAGGDDMQFITWAESASTTVLGALIGMVNQQIKERTNRDPGPSVSVPTPAGDTPSPQKGTQ
jgi:hypothetical protein